MFYKNNSPGAVLAMERDRTGNYGDYYDADEYYDNDADVCPECGSEFADFFYKNADGDCVGCSDCIYRSDSPD